MKAITTIILAFLAITGIAADRTPIYKGFLQSNLDGNQQSITNVGTVVATNFTGNGAGLTNLPAPVGSQFGSQNLTNWSQYNTNQFLSTNDGASKIQLAAATNNFFNASNSLVQIPEVNGKLTPNIFSYGTNVVGSGNKWITVTAGSTLVTGTNNPFTGLNAERCKNLGYQIEFVGTGIQLAVVGVNDANNVQCYEYVGAILFKPIDSITSSNWVIRPPQHHWTDDSVANGNFGASIDANGCPWLSAINDQSSIYFLNESNGELMQLGVTTGASLGFAGTVYAISGVQTNAVGFPSFTDFISSRAPSEARGILPDGTLANQYGETNRHSPFTLIKWSQVDLRAGIAGDGNGLTNLFVTMRTNALNTGDFPVGKVSQTNITGNITIHGFTGTDPGLYTSAVIFVTNSTGFDHTVTLPVWVTTPDGLRTYTVTNKQMRVFSFGIYGNLFTNGATVPNF